MIEAGCARRFLDEDVVGGQLIEPHALRRRGEKAPQSLDGGRKVVVAAAVHQIGPDALGLGPQSRDRIVDAAVGKHGVDHHAAARIEPARIGECNQPRRRVGLGPAREPRPAREQKCPFVMVAGLADASLDARGRRPVGGKELAQRAGPRSDELFETERGDAIRHPAPGRIIVDNSPGECGFEQMHVRVRALRQPPGFVLAKAAERMGVGLLERGAQRHGPPPPTGCLPERAVAARIGEQGEGLIVEIEGRVADFAVQIDHRYHRGVCRDEVPAEKIERVLHCFAPRAVPAEPPGLTIGECLTGDNSRPVRQRQRSAVKVDRLVEPAPGVIRSVLPP